MNKNLEYYMNLNYDIILRKIIVDGEIFYEASTRELDWCVVCLTSIIFLLIGGHNGN